jgi:hypothetical protein
VYDGVIAIGTTTTTTTTTTWWKKKRARTGR